MGTEGGGADRCELIGFGFWFQHSGTVGTMEDDMAGFSRSLTKRTINAGGE